MAQSLFRQRGIWPADTPEEPPFPEAVRYLWRWYESLALGRGSSGFGPLPIGYADIEAWGRLMNVQLERWEVETLKTLDLAYLAAQMSDSSKDAK